MEKELRRIFGKMDNELKGTFVEAFEVDVYEEENYTLEEYVDATLNEWLPIWLEEADEDTIEIYKWLQTELEKLVK